MHREFQNNRLTSEGLAVIRRITNDFDTLAGQLAVYWNATASDPRCRAITLTKLEEACFYAKKAIAMDPLMQEPEVR